MYMHMSIEREICIYIYIYIYISDGHLAAAGMSGGRRLSRGRLERLDTNIDSIYKVVQRIKHIQIRSHHIKDNK